MKRIPIKDLYCDAVDVKPINIDWQQQSIIDPHGDDPYWESWEANRCEECGELVVLLAGNGDDEHSSFHSQKQCRGHVGIAEGPMMNYWYPLPHVGSAVDGNEIQSAIAIADLPLCIVRVYDNYGLALTGGGQDLSWEIAEAYTRLGYLPPTHFELPAMSGRGTSELDRYLISAYRRSCMVLTGWLRQRMRSVRELIGWAEEQQRLKARPRKVVAR